MLYWPLGVAVNDHDEITVTEYRNHRVSAFSSDGPLVGRVRIMLSCSILQGSLLIVMAIL